MTTETYIRYKSDFKYQLEETYLIRTEIKPDKNIYTDFIHLSTTGNLVIKQGYAWDGPSGPVIDNSENLRASLVHDALYQLMRVSELDKDVHRRTADSLFMDLCIEDGVDSLVAGGYYMALRTFGEPAASPRNKKVVYYAPVNVERKNVAPFGNYTRQR